MKITYELALILNHACHSNSHVNNYFLAQSEFKQNRISIKWKKILFEMVTFCFHTSPQTIWPIISSSTHSFYWYWRRCSNQSFFLRLQISVGYSPGDVLQLWSQIVVQWIQIWTSRRPILCSYETRNIAVKLLLFDFRRMCWSRILLKEPTLSIEECIYHGF